MGSFGDSEVQSKVENADCIIAIGMVLADTNTASFTAKLNQLITVNIQPDMVKIAEAEYPNVLQLTCYSHYRMWVIRDKVW